MNEFQERVVLITGAGQGIGRRTALAFAAQGAALALNDLTPIHLDETVQAAKAFTARASAYTEDITKRMPVQWLVEQVFADWGRVDVLVNCASVRPADPLLTMDEWDWHRTLDVNLTGPFLMMQAVAPIMENQGGGAVINVGPIRRPQDGPTLLPAYAASKAGLLALTRAAAQELAASGIRVNAVFSGAEVATSPNPTIPAAPRDLEKLLVYLSGKQSGPTGGCFAFDD